MSNNVIASAGQRQFEGGFVAERQELVEVGALRLDVRAALAAMPDRRMSTAEVLDMMDEQVSGRVAGAKLRKLGWVDAERAKVIGRTAGVQRLVDWIL